MPAPSAIAATGRDISHGFLGLRDISDPDLEAALLEEVTTLFGDKYTQHLDEGAEVFAEGEHLGCLIFIADGRTQLFRVMDEYEVVFHRHSVGRILGLLSAFNAENSFFSCRALTDTHLIRVPLSEVEIAMSKNPRLSMLLDTTLLRSLARRAKRAVELQLDLERTQARLVENEKMATLGQLSAGVAHELNNPIAAIARATDHLLVDTDRIVAELGADTVVQECLHRGRAAEPTSTRDERKLARRLADHLGDERLARQYVRIGLHTPEDIRRSLEGSQDDEKRFALLQLCYQVGASLRNIGSCSNRIVDLVSSLRSYGRPDHAMSEGIDVHKGLEETLLLLGHKLHEIDVTKDFGSLPLISCRPGELNQVWTNLLSNAIEAMPASQGSIQIETVANPSHHAIHIRIIDNGAGISLEHQAKIFDVNFSTRQGPAAFGLGIGLPICRAIIERHHGELSVTSRPGHTRFEVTLPTPDTEHAEELSQ